MSLNTPSWLKKLFRKPPPAKKGEVNFNFIDRFTFVHFLIGAFYGWVEISAGWMLFLAIGWEIIENPLKFYLPSIFPHGTADTFRNMVGDTIAVALGWALIYSEILI